MIIKINSLEARIYNTESENYPYVTLNLCSKEFIENYQNELEEKFQAKPELKGIYVQEQLSNDIESLFELKKYGVIVDLYFYLRNNIDLEIQEALFEIAYSLKEHDYVEDSKYIYSKMLVEDKENSSVLNNLAIIYEKENHKEAEELIKKAKAINKDDVIINNNYERIVAKRKQKHSKKKVNEKQKNKHELEFDSQESRIIYGNKYCDIPINTYEYYLCKTVFEKDVGTKISEEDIYDVFDGARLEEKGRTIYDAHIRINKKVEENIGLKKILVNRKSLVWVREDYKK